MSLKKENTLVKVLMLQGEKGEKGDTGDIDNIDEMLEALQDVVYTKAEIDTGFYTRNETDAALENKANVSDVYTKNETDTLLDDKPNLSDVFNRFKTVKLYLEAGASVPMYGQPTSVTFHTDEIDEEDVIAFLGIVSTYFSSVITITRFEFSFNENGGADLTAYLAVVPFEPYSSGSGSITMQATDYIEVSYISTN